MFVSFTAKARPQSCVSSPWAPRSLPSTLRAHGPACSVLPHPSGLSDLPSPPPRCFYRPSLFTILPTGRAHSTPGPLHWLLLLPGAPVPQTAAWLLYRPL